MRASHRFHGSRALNHAWAASRDSQVSLRAFTAAVTRFTAEAELGFESHCVYASCVMDVGSIRIIDVYGRLPGEDSVVDNTLCA